MADVTGRYASDWCTATRRLRLRDSWWSETLQPLSPSPEEREREEEDIMSESDPLLTSIVYRPTLLSLSRYSLLSPSAYLHQ